jgi:hypothetical protein
MITEEMLNHDKYNRKGFDIFWCEDDTGEYYEVQRIDDPESYIDVADFTPPLLKDDYEARTIAITEGFEFDDEKNGFRVTGLS